jgi:transcriptional regulator with XRE-family HTH domain
MDMIGKVRRMRLRDQLSLSEIAKRTGLSRNTVKKWLKAPSDVVPKYERVKLDGKLTAFEPALHQALTTDSHRPKQGRRSGRALFAQIQAQGYRGGYKRGIECDDSGNLNVSSSDPGQLPLKHPLRRH